MHVHSYPQLFSTILSASWPFMIFVAVGRQFRSEKTFRWLLLLAGFLLVVGGEGFFAPSLLETGVFKPSSTFQWPAGYVKGVATTSSGKFVVPLTAPGRVQVYDTHWHFIGGWQINTGGGGDFKVASPSDGIIEVLTSRGLQRRFYTEGGVLLPDPSGARQDDFRSIPDGAYSAVPTSSLLWLFSNRFLCWLLGALGAAGFVFLKRTV